MPTYGLSDAGFILPRQSQIVADLQQAFRDRFGATVNLSSSTVFGQLIGIFSEREALLWEALQDDVLSNTPAGAQGVYVDNMLALTGLVRLGARATVTNPTPSTEANGKILSGLVLGGTPGTVVPAGSILQTSTTPPIDFALDAAVTIEEAVHAVQNLFLSAAPTSGSFCLTLETPSGATVTTSPIPFDAQAAQTVLTADKAPSAGAITLTIGAHDPITLPFGATAAQWQTEIAKLDKLASVGVQGAWPQGLVILWPSLQIPKVVCSETTDAQITVKQALGVYLQSLLDPYTGLMPFTDVSVTTPATNQIRLAFGALTPLDGQPSSGAMAQANVEIVRNLLFRGQTAVNVAQSSAVTGKPAQGVGTATALETGAQVVLAGDLNVIGSATMGWQSVTNPLDCLTGRATESDTEAMARRKNLLASTGAGPLAATLGRLQQLPGVTAAIGFQNLTAAALQRLNFIRTPTSGSYTLAFLGTTTPSLPFNAAAKDVQMALESIEGIESCTVSGAYTYGFVVDFEGAEGGQALPLLTVPEDTTGAALTATFGRPPKSVEYVVEGGSDAEIAQTILDASAGGITTYGSPILTTLGSCVAGSSQVLLASASNAVVGEAIFGQGLPSGAIITAIGGTTITLNRPALSDSSNVPMVISHTLTLKDAGQNPQEISFTRPVQVPIYLEILLTTDLFNTPGDATSGLNGDALFDPASVQTIEADVIEAINATAIGGLLTLRGTTGIGSSFRDVPGIVDVAIAFDVTPEPSNTANLQLLPEQVALASSFNTQVSYQ